MSIDSMKLAVCRESNPRWNESFQLKADDRGCMWRFKMQNTLFPARRSFYDFHAGTHRSIGETCREIFIRFVI